MSKKGNYAGINELNESAFFRPPSQPQIITPSPTQNNEPLSSEKVEKTNDIILSEQISLPSQKTSKKETKPHNTTTIPRYHDTTQPNNDEIIIETIRKAVRHLGKEAATYRFTQEEKKALSDIVYTYKGRGVKTSENEITRTAINFLVEDYHQKGENSILSRVLERLNE